MQVKHLEFQAKLNDTVKFMNYMVSDHLFNSAGMGIEEFDKNMSRLGLNEENDQEFAGIMAEYQ